MKGLFVFSIAFVLSSCGKDYVCECSIEGIGVIETSQIHGTKNKAKKKCDEKAKGQAVTQSGHTIPVKCTLN